jgi:hypothetical protein
MGFSITWFAVRHEDADKLTAALELTPTGAQSRGIRITFRPGGQGQGAARFSVRVHCVVSW